MLQRPEFRDTQLSVSNLYSRFQSSSYKELEKKQVRGCETNYANHNIYSHYFKNMSMDGWMEEYLIIKL